MMDYSKGREFEAAVAQHFRERGELVQEAPAGIFKPWDVAVPARGWFFECKDDLLAPRTQHALIECDWRGEPSGICTTESTHWLHKCGDVVYVIPTPELRRELFLRSYRIVAGGDHGLMRGFRIPLPKLAAIPGVKIVSFPGFTPSGAAAAIAATA